LILNVAQEEFIFVGTVIGHDTAVHAIIGGICVRIILVEPEYSPVWARFTSTKDATGLKDGELSERLAITLKVKFKSPILVKHLR
jgi:hypothetical protein